VQGDLAIGNDDQGEGRRVIPTFHLCLPPASALCMARSDRTADICLWKSITSIRCETNGLNSDALA